MSSHAQTYEQASNDAREGDDLEDDRVGHNPDSAVRIHMIRCWPQSGFCARGGMDVGRHGMGTC
jgi:hypothetical protein